MPRWSAVAAAASALLLLFLDLGHDRLIAGLLAAVIVAGAIRIDRGLPGARVDPLKTLGDWSYALYLCHVPVIRLTYELAPGSANQAALWLFAVAACQPAPPAADRAPGHPEGQAGELGGAGRGAPWNVTHLMIVSPSR